MLVAAAAAGGCGGKSGSSACASPGKAAFVFVETPRSGEPLSSGFTVKGCSRTFAGNVIWILRSTVAVQQIGQLEVDEPRVTSEGYPPTRNVLPVLLTP